VPESQLTGGHSSSGSFSNDRTRGGNQQMNMKMMNMPGNMGGNMNQDMMMQQMQTMARMCGFSSAEGEISLC
jgi:hypothetical protein